jgi:hypothetical protein
MKTPYHTKFDRYVSFDRAEFPFIPTNAESKKVAFDKMMDYSEKAVAAIEQHAGRALSPQELVHGIDHPENRTLSEVVAQSQPDPQPRFDSSTENPYQRALDMGLGNPNRKQTKEEMYQRKAAEWEAKRQTEADKAAFDADPQRQRAIAHAARELQALKFDPSATVAEIEQAETRLHVARHESLNEYREMDRHYQQEKRAKIDAATDAVTKQIEALKAKRAEIETHEFDPPAPPSSVEQPQSPKYEKILAADPRHPQYREPESTIAG